jgi:hypothetical protein
MQALQLVLGLLLMQLVQTVLIRTSGLLLVREM